MEELASSIAGPTLQFDIAWLLDPTAWVGLLTLTVIQTVLGIDNLLFIAILSAKLPPKQAKQARYLGLGGALVIRIILMLSFAVEMISFKDVLIQIVILEDLQYRFPTINSYAVLDCLTSINTFFYGVIDK